MIASGYCPKSGNRALIGLFHRIIGLSPCGAEQAVTSRGRDYEPGKVHDVSRLGKMSHCYERCEKA